MQCPCLPYSLVSLTWFEVCGRQRGWPDDIVCVHSNSLAVPYLKRKQFLDLKLSQVCVWGLLPSGTVGLLPPVFVLVFAHLPMYLAPAACFTYSLMVKMEAISSSEFVWFCRMRCRHVACLMFRVPGGCRGEILLNVHILFKTLALHREGVTVYSILCE